MKRTLLAVLATGVVAAGMAAPAEAARKPVIPKERHAQYVRDAVSMGVSETTARAALYDMNLARGLAVSVASDEPHKVALTEPTGNAEADVQLAALAATCGPYASSWSWRTYLKNGFGDVLGWSGIRTIKWYWNLNKVSCITSVNWADNTALGATTGWGDPTNTLDVGTYYTYGGVFNAAYHKQVENRFRFKPAPCFCVTVQTRYGRANMWLHPDGTADASGSWR